MVGMQNPEIKIGLLGAAGVGKSSWKRIFTDGEFSPEYTPTEQITQTVTHWSIRNAPVDSVNITIVEYPGGFIPPKLPNANENFTALIFMYSAGSKISLSSLKRYIPSASFYPAILVGNQSDLPEIKVTQAQHTTFCQEHRDIDMHTSISAKSHVGVFKPLEFALRQKYPGASLGDIIEV